MKHALVRARNRILSHAYATACKPLFFAMDPETVHDRMTRIGIILGSNPVTRGILACLFGYRDARLEQIILGIRFKNPVGLAAGFDKNALLAGALSSVGFGFAELGSVTGEPCEGNPKPRLWRLKESRALVVYYGLKNDGCEAIAKRLRRARFRFPVGISVAKTNCRETAALRAGIADYAKAFDAFAEIGDYFTVNISCPNAFGGQPFTGAKRLEALLARLDRIPTAKPVFLKLSPDLSARQVTAIIRVAGRHRIHGFICANLTKRRDSPRIKEQDVPANGGISGKVVEQLANDLIRQVYRKTNGRYVIIGTGGIFTAKDAYYKIKAGASLVQLITGMVFKGPQVISEINEGLVHLLKKDGFTNISQAVGADIKGRGCS